MLKILYLLINRLHNVRLNFTQDLLLLEFGVKFMLFHLVFKNFLKNVFQSYLLMATFLLSSLQDRSAKLIKSVIFEILFDFRLQLQENWIDNAILTFYNLLILIKLLHLHPGFKFVYVINKLWNFVVELFWKISINLNFQIFKVLSNF